MFIMQNWRCVEYLHVYLLTRFSLACMENEPFHCHQVAAMSEMVYLALQVKACWRYRIVCSPDLASDACSYGVMRSVQLSVVWAEWECTTCACVPSSSFSTIFGVSVACNPAVVCHVS
jgi:hypothetical protein